MNQPILYESHMHTPLCKHAAGAPAAYARVAQMRGLRGITVTCHNPLPDQMSIQVRMGISEFSEYVELVADAAQACRPWSDVRLGLECDYLPGLRPFLEEQLTWAPFEYVLGSVHPQLREYVTLFGDRDPVAFQKGYFDHLAMAAETGLFDCLSHPDLVKNCYAEHWDIARVLDHVERALDRIARTGVAMELNTSGRHKRIAEFNPGLEILQKMQARRIPVVLGADAHHPQRAGEGFEEALDLLAQVGYSHVHIFRERKPVAIAIDAARASLKPLTPRQQQTVRNPDFHLHESATAPDTADTDAAS